VRGWGDGRMAAHSNSVARAVVAAFHAKAAAQPVARPRPSRADR
jgi:hypothetical protein